MRRTVREVFTGTAVSLSIILSFTPSAVFAKGNFITPGAKANAMGASFVAVADDPTAVYWNPAGLSQMKKNKGFQFSGFYISNKAKSNTSLGNSVVPNISDGDFPIGKIYDPAVNALLPNAEPSQYKNTELETNAVLPFLAGYARSKGFTFAIGAYAVGGGGGKWSDTVDSNIAGDSIKASMDSQYSYMIYNVSAAKEISSKLSAGLGLDVVSIEDKTNIKKNYNASSASPLQSYSMELDKHASGYGFQMNAGLLYKYNEKIKTGFVFRSGTNVKLAGTAKSYNAGLATLGIADNGFSTSYDQNYYYPMTFGAGIAYDPVKKLTLSAGIDQNNYSLSRNDVKYAAEYGTTFVNENSDLKYKDTIQYRVGAQYRHTEKLSFMCGVQTDPVLFARDNLTLLDLNQYYCTYVSLGVGYIYKEIGFDLGLCKGITDKPEKAGRTYEYPQDIVRFGVNYGF